MFSFSWTLQPQVTVPLSHLINAFHSLKGSVVQPHHRERRREQELYVPEPSWSLRDVGLTDLGVGQLDELVDRLLPCVTQDVSSKPLQAESHPWKTSYLSTDSFFHNRYGLSVPEMAAASAGFCKRNLSALQTAHADLNAWPAPTEASIRDKRRKLCRITA